MKEAPVTTQPDSVRRFSDRAADYVRYRPGYPAAAIDAILAGLGPAAHLRAADVGAGTGISARLLGERGVRVIASEPGHDMRRAAAPQSNVAWVAGRAEAIGLRAETCGLVLSAQSFHWFSPSEALVEFARILKPRGRLAIVWNRRSLDDPLTVGYRQAIVDAGGDTEAERMRFDPAVVGGSRVFTPADRTSFPNAQHLDLEGLVGRARSASYVPKEGPAGARLTDSLRALHDRYADSTGFVTLVYETEIYTANKR